METGDRPPDCAAEVAQPQASRMRPGATAISLVILAVLAVFYMLYAAAGILLPFLFAVVLTLMLAPLKQVLTERLHLPALLAALLLVILLFVILSAVVFALAVPASAWIAKAPHGLAELQHRLGFLGRTVAFLRHGMAQVQQALQAPSLQGQGRAPAPASSPADLGGVGLSVLQGTRAALGQVFTLAVMLFFMLAEGDTLLRRLVEVLPTFREKRRAVEIATEIERNISGWLLTITAMNLLVGLANGLQMWLQGLPDPLLWGTLAFLLNYVPILGPFVGIVIFFFVALFSTPSLWQALVPPAIYLAVHTIEGQTVTPLLLARRFTLNPVLVILSLFFWDWLWGVPGAILSLPLLAIVKTVADRIPAFMPLGHLVGGAPRVAAGDRTPRAG